MRFTTNLTVLNTSLKGHTFTTLDLTPFISQVQGRPTP